MGTLIDVLAGMLQNCLDYQVFDASSNVCSSCIEKCTKYRLYILFITNDTPVFCPVECTHPYSYNLTNASAA
jgi:hypothetical protein